MQAEDLIVAIPILRRHPGLLYVLVLVPTLLVGPLILNELFGEHHLWLTLCFVLCCIEMLLLTRLVGRLEFDLEWAARERRLSPVKESVETCWLMVEKR